MKTKLFLMCVTAASAALCGVAMPTEAEVEKAVPKVERMLASEKVALESGKMTRAEVAAAAMRLAAGVDDEAAKLLLMKGAFILHVKDGNLEKAVKTMNALESAIADMPPQIVTNIIETALLGLPNKAANGARLYQLLDATKVATPSARSTEGASGLYCVIDISGGEKTERYPVSYLDAVPEGGWTDEYKTKKIVLRRIDAGTWPMMGGGVVTFTKPFYIGIFELTQKQIKLMSGMPDRKFVFEGDMRPADCLSWEEMRGKDEEFDYPKTKEVAPDSIIGKLRAKTGISRIDLQTSYQFGCAWNAGTDGEGRDVRLTGRHHSNQRDGKGGYNSRHTVVGSYPPNEWGIYDLHGNVWEVCLDRLGLRFSETDPEGPAGGERRRNLLGGCWNSADGFIFAKDYVPKTKDIVDDSGKGGYRIVINAMHDEKKDCSSAVHKAVESILKGMIKVPGRDYWLSATELTQAQWEPIMEFNLSKHKGPNLPVEMVSRDDCDVFLEKLNQTKEVLSSGFEFRLPELEEWKYAAWAGSAGCGSWVKPGVVGNVLDMAWVKENSSNELHAVATKLPNAFGFYDMLGNVWEWLSGAAPDGERGALKGCSIEHSADNCTWNQNRYLTKIQRYGYSGLRLAARKRIVPRSLLDGLRRRRSDDGVQGRLQRQQEAQKAAKETVDGYTWSFRVNNGEAEIVAENSGKFACAVSPTPTGDITIPSTLGGAKVTGIGQSAFENCQELDSVMIQEGVTHIGWNAFCGCSGLKAVTFPESLVDIGRSAFQWSGIRSVTIPPSVTNVGRQAFYQCGELASLTIPSSVKRVGWGAFARCGGLLSATIASGVEDLDGCAFEDCNGLTSMTIPSSVRSFGERVFGGCGALESVILPQALKSIGKLAFRGAGKLSSVTMLGERPSAPNNIFQECGNLKSIHVPANAKSWAGMKEWQGIPLVFDGRDE